MSLYSSLATDTEFSLASGALNNTTSPLNLPIGLAESSVLRGGLYVAAWRSTYATPDEDANARIGLVTSRSGSSVTIEWSHFGTSTTALAGVCKLAALTGLSATLEAITLYDSAPDATTSVKGKIKLAGDLGGTAALPVVKSRIVRTIGTSNSDYITTGSDIDVVLAQAYTDGDALGGMTLVFRNGTYNFAASSIVYAKSRTRLRAETAGAVTLNFASGSYLRVQAVTDVVFEGLKFVTTDFSGIRFVSGSRFMVENCTFTGTGDATSGVLSFWGAFGVSGDITDVTLSRNKFQSITGTSRAIHVYPNNSHTYKNFTFDKNEFDTISGSAIGLDTYYYLSNVWVTRNKFKDLLSGGHNYDSGVAVMTTTSATLPYINGLHIDDNEYDNGLEQPTGATGFGEGFAWVYSSRNVFITNNRMKGNWNVANNASRVGQGPAIAPGRTSYPVENMVISGNTIEAFDSPWDPDSMRYVNVHNNIVISCGETFNLGYNIQEYVDIHHNISFDCGYRNVLSYGTMMITSNANHVKCTYDNNKHYYSSTGVTAVIAATGHAADHSDIIFRNNTWYAPLSTFAAFSAKEYGDSVDVNLSRTSGNQIIGTVTYADVNTFLASLGVVGKLTAGAGVNMGTGVTVPTLASSTGITGDIAYDGSYVYICTGTNTWKRVAIATW